MTTPLDAINAVIAAVNRELGIPTPYEDNLELELDEQVSYEDRIYVVTVAGTTATTGGEPTHTSGKVTTGTAELEWVGYNLDPNAAAAAEKSSGDSVADAGTDIAAISANRIPPSQQATLGLFQSLKSQFEEK